MSTQRNPNILQRLLFLLALGAGIGLWLVYHHVEIVGGYLSQPSFCNIGAYFNCDEVARSEFAEVLGIPVASWSLVYYLGFFLFVSSFSLSWPGRKIMAEREEATIVNASFALATVALVPSVILLSLSLLVIGALCLFCLGLDLLNFVIWTMLFVHPARKRGKMGIAAFIEGTAKLICLVTPGFSPPLELSSTMRHLFWRRLILWSSLGLIIGVTLRIPVWLVEGIFEPRRAKLMERSHLLPLVEQWQAAPLQQALLDWQNLGNDPARGLSNAPLTLVEFADFQCPACRRAASILHKLVEQFPQQLQLVFVNFPLDAQCNPSIPESHHEFACKAAKMVNCAGEQGMEKFWQMHSRLFAISIWSETTLNELPAAIALNQTVFNQCLQSTIAEDKLRKEIDLGIALRISGTPSLYLNGRSLTGIQLEALPGMIKLILEQGASSEQRQEK